MKVNLLVCTAVFCAYMVKGMCGFANTLIFTSILSFRSNNIQITPIDLLLGIPSNILLAYKERKSIQMKVWGPLAVMAVAGGIPGILMLKYTNATFLKLILGITITGIGIEMLCREFQKKKRKSSKIILLLIGIISGLLCGLFGIGALLAAYIGRTTETTEAFRGNISMVFLIDNSVRLVLYCISGIITWNIVKTTAVLVPFMLIGLSSGMLLSKVMNERRMKIIVIVMLIVSGISLFLTNLM